MEDTNLAEIYDLDFDYIQDHKHNHRNGDYVYAMYYPTLDDETRFAFRCRTPLKIMLFLFSKEYYQSRTGKESPDEREFLWIESGKRWRIPEHREKVYQGKIADPNLGPEYFHFNQAYNVGEYISCPAKRIKDTDTVMVKISPSIWVPVESRDLAEELSGERPHAEYIFRITKNERVKQKSTIELKYVPTPERIWSIKTFYKNAATVLPESPRAMFVPKALLQTMNTPENQRVRDVMLRQLGSPLSDTISVQEISAFCQKKYREEYRNDCIFVRQYDNAADGYFQLGIKDKNGVLLYCRFAIKNNPKDLTIVSFGLIAPEQMFDRFVTHAYWVIILHDICLKTGTDFASLSNAKKNAMVYIIRMYFYKAYTEGKLLTGENGAAFVSGFLDKSGAPIYCLLKRIKEDADKGDPWLEYDKVVSGSDEEEAKSLIDNFRTLPQIPQFMSRCQMSDFEYHSSFFVSIDEKSFVSREMVKVGTPGAKSFAFKYSQTFCKRLKEQILAKIEASTSDGVTKLTPCYYPKADSVAWLVPVSFKEESEEEDDKKRSWMAVLCKTSEECYSVLTLFDSKMAYQRAELFAAVKRMEAAGEQRIPEN